MTEKKIGDVLGAGYTISSIELTLPTVSCQIAVDFEGVSKTLSPLPDITAQESALLAIWLFCHTAINSSYYKTNIDFLMQHGLMRHFSDP